MLVDDEYDSSVRHLGDGTRKAESLKTTKAPLPSETRKQKRHRGAAWTSDAFTFTWWKTSVHTCLAEASLQVKFRPNMHLYYFNYRPWPSCLYLWQCCNSVISCVIEARRKNSGRSQGFFAGLSNILVAESRPVLKVAYQCVPRAPHPSTKGL